MAGRLFGTASAGNSAAPAIAGFKVQTSVYGLPIPIVYGTARLAGNLIHLKSQPPVALTTPGHSSKLVKVNTQVTGYRYTAAVAIALCEGPIAALGKAWRDKAPSVFGRYLVDGWSLFAGTSAPTPWSYLTSVAPSEAVPYQYTAYVAHAALDLPDDVLGNYTWEVTGFAARGGGIVDANPAAILADLLTDPTHGIGFPAAQLASLADYTAYCDAMGLFLSPVLDGLTAAKDTIAALLEASNSAAAWYDGALHVVPYGDQPVTGDGVNSFGSFTPNTTPVYDLTDDDFQPPKGTDPVRVERKRAADAFNKFTVNYEDRATDYNPSVQEAKDQASIEAGGGDPIGVRPAQPLQLSSIKTAAIARLIAQLRLQREQFIRNTYRFELPMRYALLTPMDLVTLTDAGLGLVKAPVRLVSVDESESGTLAMVAEEWPLGVAHASQYGAPGALGYSSAADVDPGSTATPAIFEGPGALGSAALEIWIAATGGANWGGCEVWMSTDNVNFRKVGSVVGSATMGTLRAALTSTGASAYPPVDGANTLAVDVGTTGALGSGVVADLDQATTLCHVDGEFLAYEVSTLVGTGQYNLNVLARGLYGSPIPSSHLGGSVFVRCDSRVLRVPYPNGQDGQQVYFKFPAFNAFGNALEDIASVTSYLHTLGRNFVTAAPSDADASLADVRTSDAGVLSFVRGPAVAAVWGAFAVVSAPVTNPDWDPVVAALAPLAGGATTFTATPPGDGQATMVQLVPYRADGTAGPLVRRVLSGLPQVPTCQYDDKEVGTIGTEWLKLIERGIAVTSVEALTQVASGAFTSFAAPTRGPGATSVVKGGVLGPNEYEQDVPLSTIKGRQSFIRFEWTLANGTTVTSPDFGFDADRDPNIVSIAKAGTVLTVTGDSDTKSVLIKSTTRAWVKYVDGQFLTADVAVADDSGNAGLAASTTDTFLVRVFNEPVVEVGAGYGATPPTGTSAGYEDQQVTVYNGTGTGGTSGSPLATWITVTAAAPSIGHNLTQLSLKATAAPTGWTVKVFMADPDSAPMNDVTASLSPTLTAPPTTLSNYTIATETRAGSGGSSTLITINGRAELRDGSGVVQDTKTFTVSYYA